MDSFDQPRADSESSAEGAAAQRPAGSASWWTFRIFMAIFLVAFISLQIRGGSGNMLEDAYRSIGLFTTNTSWAFDRVAVDGQPDALKNGNQFYRVLAVVAPLLTALGLVELTTGRVGRLVVYARMMFQLYIMRRRGVGVFGLTEQGFHFARDVKASGEIAFVVSNAQETALADRCEREGIAVCRRRASWLARPRPRGQALGQAALPVAISRVHTIVSFLPDIGQQIDLAAQLAQWAPKARPASSSGAGPDEPVIPPRLCLLTADRGLTQLLEDRLTLAADKREDAKVQPRLLDMHSLAARQLLNAHPLDALADAFGQTRIHIAIYGFGPLGRTIVKQAAQLYVTRPSLDGVRLHVSVIDRQGSAALAALFAEDPGLEQVITIDVQQAVQIVPGGLTDLQVASIVPADVTAHIMAFEDNHLAFTTALSLRRWLLQPPAHLDTGWRQTHGLAPIFVPAADWTGMGRLYREVPDGVFGYGAMPDSVAADAILNASRERGAMAIHAAYQARVRGDGERAGRPASAQWAALAPSLRESNFHAYDHIAIKARALGYRFTRHAGARQADSRSPAGAELRDLERLEHLRYMAERQASSWRPAARRFDAVRVHPDLVAWADLKADEQALDRVQIDALPTIAAAAGRRFAPAFVIGVSGHRDLRPGMNEDAVRAWLRQTLDRLKQDNPGCAPVLLTSLAKGSDSWAAEAAMSLQIPFIVPLPLPYELYREDFSASERRSFHALIAAAEYYMELPMRFGTASELTRQGAARLAPGEADPASANRARQYALAGAYIFERAHQMIYVTETRDGQAAAVGSTDFVRGWHRSGSVEQDYHTPSHFFPRPADQATALVFGERAPSGRDQAP